MVFFANISALGDGGHPETSKWGGDPGTSVLSFRQGSQGEPPHQVGPRLGLMKCLSLIIRMIVSLVFSLIVNMNTTAIMAVNKNQSLAKKISQSLQIKLK